MTITDKRGYIWRHLGSVGGFAIVDYPGNPGATASLDSSGELVDMCEPAEDTRESDPVKWAASVAFCARVVVRNARRAAARKSFFRRSK